MAQRDPETSGDGHAHEQRALHPPLEDGPYYVCRLADGSTQCDCAEWTYQIAENRDGRKTHCKHLAALAALGWI